MVETTLMFDKSLEKHTNYIIIMTPSCNSDNGGNNSGSSGGGAATATVATDYNGA